MSYPSVLKKMSLCLAATVCLSPSLSSAQDILYSSVITTGDTCDVKNPAARNIRRQDGGFVNITYDTKFYVSCPIPIEWDGYSYSIGLTVANDTSSGVTQDYNCVLEEYDLSNFKIRGYSRKATLAPGRVTIIAYDNIQLRDADSRLHMWCSLPPRSTIGIVGIDSYF